MRAAKVLALILPATTAFQIPAILGSRAMPASQVGPWHLHHAFGRREKRLRVHSAPPASRLSMQQDPARSSLTSTSAAASFNLAKAIVGAGSFSLPYVLRNEGLLGGLGTIVLCAVLASYTMKSMIESKNEVELRTGQTGLSYVETTRLALGDSGARVVFTLTAMASLPVCASYRAFIGSTLGSMAAQDGNVLNSLIPGSMTL